MSFQYRCGAAARSREGQSIRLSAAVASPPNSFVDAAEADGRMHHLDSDETPQARLIALLGTSPISIDELSRVANLPTRETRAILLELELSGRLMRSGSDLVSLAVN